MNPAGPDPRFTLLARAFARSADEAESLRAEMLAASAAAGAAVSEAERLTAALVVCRAQARKRRLERTVAENLAAKELPVSARSDPQAGEIFHAALEDALSRIEPAQAEALRLCALAGMSGTEAAGALGVPEEAVRSALFKARRHLADLLTSNLGARP